MSITEKTKISLSIPQWIALICLIFSVSGGFAVVNNTATDALEKTVQNKKEIDQLKHDSQSDRDKMIELIQQVRESQIRIEGKLDLKQDKYAK